jgi:hypothetical protein
LRDHLLNVHENGLSQAEAGAYMGETIDKLVGAQMDTIAVLLGVQKTLKEAAEGLQALIYKKKEPSPTNGAMTE